MTISRTQDRGKKQDTRQSHLNTRDKQSHCERGDIPLSPSKKVFKKRKKFQKTLDKSLFVWYNIYVIKRGRIQVPLDPKERKR
jgi:hypothetical protein